MADDPAQDVDAHDGRHETLTERLDRNWTEILQELRVVQTGTQILAGFLLTLPFQQRFATLDQHQVWIYLALVVLAAIATLLALCPVALHRALFRRKAKPQIVRIANIVLKAALVAIALTLSGTTLFIFDIVISVTAGLIAGIVTLIACAAAWLALPMFSHHVHTLEDTSLAHREAQP